MRYSSRTNLLGCVCLESGIQIRTGQVLNDKAMGAIFIFMKELEVPSLQRIDSFWRVPEGRNAFWMVSPTRIEEPPAGGSRMLPVISTCSTNQEVTLKKPLGLVFFLLVDLGSHGFGAP